MSLIEGIQILKLNLTKKTTTTANVKNNQIFSVNDDDRYLGEGIYNITRRRNIEHIVIQQYV